MSEWISFEKDKAHISRERKKARDLRSKAWWKNQLTLGICHYCKRHFLPDELTMDHIVPLARGGKSTKGNCVPCCKTCNKAKSILTPAEMILNRLKEK